MGEDGSRRRATISPSTTVSFLLGTSLFRGCDRQPVVSIVPHLNASEFPAGTVIQAVGSLDGQIGIVVNGHVVIRQIHPVTGKATAIEALTIGDSFGEVGAFTQGPHPVEAFAEERSTVILLPKEVVEALARNVPEFAQAMARRTAGKILQLPATFPPNETTTLPGPVRSRIEELVMRMEAELANDGARDGLDLIRDALSLLPQPPHQWVEAGWLFNRAAGLRLGLGDAEGAVVEATHALHCTGWEDDPRALVRLAQAQIAAGDPMGRETLLRAYSKGGREWLEAVAPDLVHLLRF